MSIRKHGVPDIVNQSRKTKRQAFSEQSESEDNCSSNDSAEEGKKE